MSSGGKPAASGGAGGAAAAIALPPTDAQVKILQTKIKNIQKIIQKLRKPAEAVEEERFDYDESQNKWVPVTLGSTADNDASSVATGTAAISPSAEKRIVRLERAKTSYEHLIKIINKTSCKGVLVKSLRGMLNRLRRRSPKSSIQFATITHWLSLIL